MGEFESTLDRALSTLDWALSSMSTLDKAFLSTLDQALSTLDRANVDKKKCTVKIHKMLLKYYEEI